MRLILLLSFVLGFPVLSNADDVPIPDVGGWTILKNSISRIEIRISDLAVAYLGFTMDYANPENPDEFIRVIRRHIPIVIFRNKIEGNAALFREMIVLRYSQKEEQDRLSGMFDKSDPIIFIKGKTKIDSRTGRRIVDGDISFWLMTPDGDWTFALNEPVGREFLTENFDKDGSVNIFMGVKYQLGSSYHILRVDRSDLEKLYSDRSSR